MRFLKSRHFWGGLVAGIVILYLYQNYKGKLGK
jgi:hypothetical protein